jgi:hypothetical protein
MALTTLYDVNESGDGVLTLGRVIGDEVDADAALVAESWTAVGWETEVSPEAKARATFTDGIDPAKVTVLRTRPEKHLPWTYVAVVREEKG